MTLDLRVWTKSAITGRIRIQSSNLAAGQYLSRNTGSYGNLVTTDSFSDAIQVRIAPRQGGVILEAIVSFR